MLPVLRILKEQMTVLAAQTRRRFVARMAAYLRQHFTDSVDEMSRADLESWVSDAVAVAERYRITTEPEVAQVVLLLLALGLDADETTPWVKSILRDPELVGRGKVRALAAAAQAHEVPGVGEVLVVEEVIEA
jgi:hypothetical protein